MGLSTSIVLSLALLSQPAFEDTSKQDLWNALQICDARVTDRDILHQGCMNKLATRTSTAVNKLVVPPVPEQSGVGLEWIVGGVLIGFILGFLLKGNGVTVIR